MATHGWNKHAAKVFDGPPKAGLRARSDEAIGCGEPSREEARTLSFVMQASGLGHWRYDVRSGRFDCSMGCKATFGLGRDARLSSVAQLMALVHPDDRALVRSSLEHALDQREGDDYFVEHRIVTPAGEVRWISARGRVCRRRPERPVLAGISIDITAHKRLEAERERLMSELAAERARLRALVDHMPAAVIVGGADGRVVLANPAVDRVFPLPSPPVPVDSGVLYRVWAARHPDGAPVKPHERPLSRALHGETVPEQDYRYLRGDGTEAWLRLSAAPIRSDDGGLAGAVVIASDITERVQSDAERESLLRSFERSEERYRLAALATDDAIYDWEIRKDRVTVHRMFAHGYDSVWHLDSWAKLIHPDDRERVLCGLQAALAGGEHHWHGEYRFAKGDGSWITITDRGYIVHDGAGEPVRMVGAMQDVTDRRRQEEFERQLIGIVSHDLKNPLNTILLAAGMVVRSEEIGERAVRNTVRIQGAARRASRMIRDLLDFTRARLGGGIPIERRNVSLGAVFRELVEDLRVGHPGRQVLLEATGDPTGDFDGDRLAQVLTNLTENALKYSPTGSPVRVLLDGAGADVVLSVHNGGAPIPGELLPKIFEPLTRGDSAFDPDGRSVGLGLYIVKQLVGAHGGTIEVRSTEADGTEFVVRLPRYAESLPPPDVRIP